MNSGRLTENSRTALAEVTVPLALGLVSFLLAVLGDAGRVALRFDRDALGEGQIWRLLSGHLVHLGIGHVLLNVAGLAVLAYVFSGARLTVRWWIVTTLASAAAIDAGLLALEPQLDWYVGLSGVLHGIWASGTARLFARGERWYSVALAVVLVAKLLAESVSGPSAVTQYLSGGDVVAAAHLYGAVGGAAAAVWLANAPKLLRRFRQL